MMHVSRRPRHQVLGRAVAVHSMRVAWRGDEAASVAEGEDETKLFGMVEAPASLRWLSSQVLSATC